MKIIVYGACGRTGKLVCQEAKRRGYETIGVVRQPCEIDGVKTYLVARKRDIVEEMLSSDAVISVVGHTSISEKNTQTRATEEIIKMMNNARIKRFVSLTGTGVRVDNDKVSLLDQALNSFLKIVDKSRINDGVEHFHILKNSDLHWTVLRVLKLVSGDGEQGYKLTPNGPAKTAISRQTVAKILLDIAVSNDWIAQAPVVSPK